MGVMTLSVSRTTSFVTLQLALNRYLTLPKPGCRLFIDPQSSQTMDAATSGKLVRGSCTLIICSCRGSSPFPKAPSNLRSGSSSAPSGSHQGRLLGRYRGLRNAPPARGSKTLSGYRLAFPRTPDTPLFSVFDGSRGSASSVSIPLSNWPETPALSLVFGPCVRYEGFRRTCGLAKGGKTWDFADINSLSN